MTTLADRTITALRRSTDDLTARVRGFDDADLTVVSDRVTLAQLMRVLPGI